MKKNEIKELAVKSVNELKILSNQMRFEINKISIDKESRKLHNVALLGQKKKDLARILTVLRRKEMNAI